jgi:hypothetical protein
MAETRANTPDSDPTPPEEGLVAFGSEDEPIGDTPARLSIVDLSEWSADPIGDFASEQPALPEPEADVPLAIDHDPVLTRVVVPPRLEPSDGITVSLRAVLLVALSVALGWYGFFFSVDMWEAFGNQFAAADTPAVESLPLPQSPAAPPRADDTVAPIASVSLPVVPIGAVPSPAPADAAKESGPTGTVGEEARATRPPSVPPRRFAGNTLPPSQQALAPPAERPAPSRGAPPGTLSVLPAGPAAAEPAPSATAGQTLSRTPLPATDSADDPPVGSREAASSSQPAAFAPSPSAAAPPVATSAIHAVLNRYANAYSRLDARSAKDVWPGVNERDLARAFATLETQQFDLGTCRVEITLPRAVATCDGTIRYVPKVGGRSVRSQPRNWKFSLTQDGEQWAISSVESR